MSSPKKQDKNDVKIFAIIKGVDGEEWRKNNYESDPKLTGVSKKDKRNIHCQDSLFKSSYYSHYEAKKFCKKANEKYPHSFYAVCKINN